MRRLLEIEYYKIRYHGASLRLLLSYYLLIPMLILLSNMEISFGGISSTVGGLGIFEFPFIWHFGTYISLYLKFILVIVVISSVTGEYSNLTIKQNLIDGLSKKEFLLSKVSMAIVLALVSVVVSFFTFFYIGWKNSSELDWALVFSELDYFLGYFIRLVGFLMFGIFTAVLLRRSALALGFIAIWWIVEGIIRVSLTKALGTTGSAIASLLPLQSMGGIVEQPFQRIQLIQNASEQLGQKIDFIHGVHYFPMLQSVIWIGIFIFLSYQILRSRDL